MKTRLFVALLALAAGVQAGEADHVKSEALQIVQAAHFKNKLRDTTAEDIAKNPPAPSQGSTGAAVGLAAGTATGVFSALPGLSKGLSTGLSVANAIETFPKFDIVRTARLIAFMPKEMAATADEAREKMVEILLTAAKAAMPNASVELVLTPPKSREQNYLAVVRPGCVDCRMFIKPLEEYVRPKLQKTPQFLGGVDEVWAWGEANKQGDGLLSGYPWEEKSMTPEERQTLLIALSAHLPAWASIYTPPDAERLAPYAQVLRGGQVKLFLDPQIDPQITTPTVANFEQPES